MKRMLTGFSLLLLSAGSAFSDHRPVGRFDDPFEVDLASVALEKVYGLLLGAPEAGCRRVRYRVETESRVLLGKTPALRSGEVAMVRIGNGFQAGAHTLVVTAEGCQQAPVISRRVTLRKVAPDHGWRSSMINASLELKH